MSLTFTRTSPDHRKHFRTTNASIGTVAARRPFVRRMFFGSDTDPRWARPAFIALLIATAAFYFYNLTASGYGNEFYAAAVQSGTKSWKAFFFGSSDWSNAITVDKTPASLWPMEIFGRIFGFRSWTMLAPNVLEGIASVGLMYAAVKRWFGAGAGLIAGAVLAVTPVAALMFRFNNPDAALVFLLVAAAYCTTRAIESHGLRWMIATGLCIGFGFLAKELQAMLVVPGLGLAYLVAAPAGFAKRVAHLIAGLGAMIAGAGWWLLIASLWPASSRPFFGGSTNNSILEVITGGNGLARLTGNSGTSGGGGGGGANFSGTPGIGRLFNNLMGGQISWLLPATIISLVLGLWLTRRTVRTNRARAGLVLWGGWLGVTALTFSYMNGTVHTYYTVALAPAIGAILGMVLPRLWHTRATWLSRLSLLAMLGATGAWSYTLLDRTPTWHPWIRIAVIVLCLLGAAGLLAEPIAKRVMARFGLLIAAFALTGALLGPAAYAAQTVSTAHTGSIPSAGPSTGSSMGGGFGGGTRGGTPPDGLRSFTPPSQTEDQNASASPSLADGALPGGSGAGGGAMGGTTSVSSALVQLLQTDASKYRWAAATVGSQSSAGIQLASNEPVMSIGGFTGSDPSPTLAEFQSYVATGQIHYFISGGGGRGGGMGGDSSISAWVTANFTAQTVGGQTVYDLTAPTS